MSLSGYAFHCASHALQVLVTLPIQFCKHAAFGQRSLSRFTYILCFAYAPPWRFHVSDASTMFSISFCCMSRFAYVFGFDCGFGRILHTIRVCITFSSRSVCYAHACYSAAQEFCMTSMLSVTFCLHFMFWQRFLPAVTKTHAAGCMNRVRI